VKPQIHFLVVGRTDALARSLRQVPAAPPVQVRFCPASGSPEDCLLRDPVRAGIFDADGLGRRAVPLFLRLKKADPLISWFVVDSPGSPDAGLAWVSRGAADYLTKPVEAPSLEGILDRVSRQSLLRRETLRLEKELEKRYVFQGMISKNPFMFEVFSRLDSLAKHFSTVLITGETGTGKDLAARAIHGLSPVRRQKFVVCDCTSIPDSLFESELFGYVRGAFTGAGRDKTGLFEEAEGGIIFLDEVGEVPPAVQSKLLRVLENREFRPVGSSRSRTADVRVIAASNRNLRGAVQAGTFRSDLFHRLSRVEVFLPPLRERPEDIPLLTGHLLERFRKKFGKTLLGVSRDVQKAFLTHDWPGNIRELENVLESSAMVCAKDFIDIGDLPEYLRRLGPGRTRPASPAREDLLTLDDMERRHIFAVLQKTGRNLFRASGVLGISRTTLYAKMKKYGIPR